MYCSNCGDRVSNNDRFCANCGAVLEGRIKRPKKNLKNFCGFVSIVLGVVAFLFCINGYIFGDITSVGMYVKLIDRFFYAVSYNFIQSGITFASLVFALINKKNIYNKIGLGISLVTIFLILTEYVVILIY